MTLAVSSGEKFACVALKSAVSGLSGMSVQPGARFQFSGELPFDVEDQTIGSICADRLRRSTLFLLAKAASKWPHGIDDDNEQLNRDVRGFLYSSMLYGLWCKEFYRQEPVLLLTGSCPRDRPIIQTTESCPAIARCPNSIRSLEAADFGNVVAVADSLRRVFDSGKKHLRIKRGFNAWIAGAHSTDASDGHHQFTRSIEALMKPPKGKTTEQFADRGQLFIGTGDDRRSLLKEIYRLRSCREHMNDYHDTLDKYPTEAEREEIAFRREFQVETLANRLYARVLATPELLEIFAEDRSIEAFWGRPEVDRMRIWGAPVDLDTEVDKYFRRIA